MLFITHFDEKSPSKGAFYLRAGYAVGLVFVVQILLANLRRKGESFNQVKKALAENMSRRKHPVRNLLIVEFMKNMINAIAQHAQLKLKSVQLNNKRITVIIDTSHFLCSIKVNG